MIINSFYWHTLYLDTQMYPLVLGFSAYFQTKQGADFMPEYIFLMNELSLMLFFNEIYDWNDYQYRE